MTIPAGTIDRRYSDGTAVPTPWTDVTAILDASQIFWVTTVRPDGRPHVTPLIAVRVDGRLYFSTGPEERKAVNLEANGACVLTTGSNSIEYGTDVVVEGIAAVVTDRDLLERVADAYRVKYGREWSFEVREGRFVHTDAGGQALVFGLTADTVFAFQKGNAFAQTRWRL
ncbi:pyridoxamine 5'-phosphate oxidase family protein [Rhodococcus gannanensis]|uniref:Pyridoxamine 5'-phosphate oxidase family protein n=1 Tax=Rhodococcus gannanensis TaxID=1960308 RepID=A0ABW4P3D5_9NOCA